MSRAFGSQRANRALDAFLKAVAALLLFSMLCAALHDVSRAWDVWYYHLPFAARIAGIMGPESLLFSAKNRAHLDGFPLLGELLQGLLWRASGRLEAANLVSFACVPAFAVFLRRRFGVPPHLSCLALLAVPLIHIHATSCYVDLLGNSATAALLLIVLDAYAKRAPPSRTSLFSAALAAAVASNTKLLLEPVVFVALAALALRALPALLRRGPQLRRRRRTLLACCLALPIVFFTPLSNTLRHANPVYPERVALAGFVLPGPEEPYSASPTWLAHVPQPLRFMASVFELGLPPLLQPRRWTIDQWTLPSAPGYRLGGFFGIYVAAQLAALALFARRDGSLRARRLLYGFLALTAFTSLLPQSHELRYYSFWIITLIALNLWLSLRSPAAPSAMGVLALLSLCVVLANTRGGYAYPSGITFRELVREQVDPAALRKIAPGERVCARRQPYAFLWAAPFHPPLSYRLRVSEDELGCAGDRPID